MRRVDLNGHGPSLHGKQLDGRLQQAKLGPGRWSLYEWR